MWCSCCDAQIALHNGNEDVIINDLIDRTDPHPAEVAAAARLLEDRLVPLELLPHARAVSRPRRPLVAHRLHRRVAREEEQHAVRHRGGECRDGCAEVVLVAAVVAIGKAAVERNASGPLCEHRAEHLQRVITSCRHSQHDHHGQYSIVQQNGAVVSAARMQGGDSSKHIAQACKVQPN
jgi:hypothetical protein